MAVAEFGIGARFKILNLEVQLLSATPTLKEVIMKNMSQQKKALIAAFDKGYRVVNGEVISPFNKKSLSLYKTTAGYLAFCINMNRRRYNIPVHRLLAYQKYRDEIFEEGIEVRHFDNNKINNLDDNIAIGTHQENTVNQVVGGSNPPPGATKEKL